MYPNLKKKEGQKHVKGNATKKQTCMNVLGLHIETSNMCNKPFIGGVVSMSCKYISVRLQLRPISNVPYINILPDTFFLYIKK